MNQKLVDLANKAGFKSAMFTDTEWKHSEKEDLRWYLWVCELRRWFMKEHKVLIEIFRVYDGNAPIYDYIVREETGLCISVSCFKDERNEINCDDEIIIETALLAIFSADKDLLLKLGINLNL